MVVSVCSGNKIRNSTKQLTPTQSMECKLKNGCNLVDPVLLLYLNPEEFPKWNELYFDSRYYVVTDIVSVRDNLWEVHCHIDTLATWKSAILASKGFIEYYTHTNTEISDPRLGSKTTATYSAASGSLSMVSGSGTWAVSVVGEHTAGVYKISGQSALDDLIPSWTDVWTESFSDIPEFTPPDPEEGTDDFLGIVSAIKYGVQYIGALLKYVILDVILFYIGQLLFAGDAGSNLKDAWWAPWDLQGGGGGTIYLGRYKTNVSGTKLHGVNQTNCVVSIPWQYSDWRNNSPYTQIFLFLPFLGTIPIAPADVQGISSLSVTYTISNIDASFTCSVKASSRVIYSGSGHTASHLMVGNGSFLNYGQAMATAITSAASIAAGGTDAAISTVSGAAANALSIIDTMGASVGGMSGSTGIGAGSVVTCWTVCHTPVDNIHAISPVGGEPALVTMTIPSSGYVKTRSFKFDAAGISAANSAGAITATELDELEKYMDSGVYIE